MSLTKYRIGDLIEIIDEKNDLGIRNFCGINIDKEIGPTSANTSNLDERKYKILRKYRFVYSGMQTGRDKAIRISMYLDDELAIVSPAYTTFEVTKIDIIDPMYFDMFFKSKEKDRLGWFYSDSSIRSNLDWDRFCDIEIDIPTIEIQKKYVNIYKALLANQEAYEIGLEDLKLVCDATIEEINRKYKKEEIGPYINRIDERNKDNLIKNVKGVSTNKIFREPTSKVNRDKLSNYKIVYPGDISFVQTTHNEKVFAYAFNDTDEKIVVTPVNEVFKTNKKLMPEYLSMFFNRKEFDRYARFHSWGSARETFTWGDLTHVNIPIVHINLQKSVTDIYKIYNERKKINEKLKQRIRNICPVLIKGAIEEASL